MEGRHEGHDTDAAFYADIDPFAPAPPEQMEAHRATLRARGVDEDTVTRLYPYDADTPAGPSTPKRP